jgi:alkylation response protein AidB-like acyl-CoA dehydrogenase
MVSRATKDGNGWVLNGTKRFISNAGPAKKYTFFAVSDPQAGRGKNISCFIVDRDNPGFEIGRKEHKLGIRGAPTAEVILNDYRASDDDLVGEAGSGFAIAMRTLDFSRPTVAAQALGIAQGALDYAIGYAKERKQFGKPIITFQGIEFMLADMAMKVEASRMLVYRAAEAVIAKDPKVSYHAAIAKCYASDTAMSVTTDAVQILGGYGYVSEYPVERMMRDAKITQIYEGTNQIQRVVIARALAR